MTNDDLKQIRTDTGLMVSLCEQAKALGQKILAKLESIENPANESLAVKKAQDSGEDWDDDEIEDDDLPVEVKQKTVNQRPSEQASKQLQSNGPSPGDLIGNCASEDDLNSPHGNPTVFYDPNRWEGPSYKGKKYSECPADYLLALANMLDWIAQTNAKNNVMASNGKPKHIYQELDAKRARGWARRKMKTKNSDSESVEKTVENNKPNINVDDYNF